MGNEQSTEAGLSEKQLRDRDLSKVSSGIQDQLGKPQWNMRLVIRGDVMSGKSSLLRRLKGKQHRPAYYPDTELDASMIPWDYKVTSERILVTVWDVPAVSSASSAANHPIMTAHESPSQGRQKISAATGDMVDLNRGTHATVFIFDVTKPWTWDWVCRELGSLERVPPAMPVVVLGNFSDVRSPACHLVCLAADDSSLPMCCISLSLSWPSLRRLSAGRAHQARYQPA